MAETFHGYIDTTQDVLLIFEGCRRGLLPRVNRRLQEKERKMIQSGSVFVFDERESGVKRWTDGLVWSPSRILGNFLIYRELEKRNGEKRLSISDQRQRSYSVDVSSTIAAAGGGMGGFSADRIKEKRLVGSLSDVYNFKVDGLVKKTMSIVVNGSTQHLISYYHPQDIIDNKLRTPSSVPELASLEISPELLVKQNFRIPPFVEPALDSSTDTPINSPLEVHPHSQHLQQQQQQQQHHHFPMPHQRSQQQHYQGHQSMARNGHGNNINDNGTAGSSLRSMSVGSLNSLKQESLLYSNHQPTSNMTDFDPYQTNLATPNDDTGKSSKMYSLYMQQQQDQHQPQQQQIHSVSASPTSSTSHIMSSSSVYSSLPASTPSPNSIRYDLPLHQPPATYNPDDQKYPGPPANPQIGHLLNPVHSFNAAAAASVDSSVPHGSSDIHSHHDHELPVKMESLDQPIFYSNRSSPLSTTNTPSLI